VWAKVEPVFAAVKRLRDFTRVGYRGLVTKASRAFTPLALANRYLARGRLTGEVRLQLARKGHEKPAERRFSTNRATMSNLRAHQRELSSEALIKVALHS
jgi:hypothetical protein